MINRALLASRLSGESPRVSRTPDEKDRRGYLHVGEGFSEELELRATLGLGRWMPCVESGSRQWEVGKPQCEPEDEVDQLVRRRRHSRQGGAWRTVLWRKLVVREAARCGLRWPTWSEPC